MTPHPEFITIDLIGSLAQRRAVRQMMRADGFVGGSERWASTRYTRARIRDAYRFARRRGLSRNDARYVVTAAVMLGSTVAVTPKQMTAAG